MIVEEVVNKFIRDNINSILNLQNYAIRARQDAPRPLGAYCDVAALNETSYGIEQSEFQNNVGDDDLTETLTGIRQLMFSINFYRDSALDNARKFKIGLSRSSVLDLMQSAGLGLATRSEVRDLSETFENGWENRAQFDLTFNTVASDSDLVRSIMTLDISGEYQASGLSYNFSIAN